MGAQATKVSANDAFAEVVKPKPTHGVIRRSLKAIQAASRLFSRD
jgi:hypothetical protein